MTLPPEVVLNICEGCGLRTYWLTPDSPAHKRGNLTAAGDCPGPVRAVRYVKADATPQRLPQEWLERLATLCVREIALQSSTARSVRKVADAGALMVPSQQALDFIADAENTVTTLTMIHNLLAAAASGDAHIEFVVADPPEGDPEMPTYVVTLRGPTGAEVVSIPATEASTKDAAGKAALARMGPFAADDYVIENVVGPDDPREP